MGLDDLVNKGKDLYEQNKDKVDKAVHSEQAEGVSDSILDGVAGFAKKVTGGKFDEQIDGARDKADDAIGDK